MVCFNSLSEPLSKILSPIPFPFLGIMPLLASSPFPGARPSLSPSHTTSPIVFPRGPPHPQPIPCWFSPSLPPAFFHSSFCTIVDSYFSIDSTFLLLSPATSHLFRLFFFYDLETVFFLYSLSTGIIEYFWLFLTTFWIGAFFTEILTKRCWLALRGWNELLTKDASSSQAR